MSYTTQAQFLERFKAFTDRMNAVVAPKNQDYAGSDDAFANLRRHGLYGVLVRMEDKISRLNGFVTRDGKLQVADEKAEDTAVDLANYAGILVIMIQEMVDLLVQTSMTDPVRPVRIRRKITSQQSGQERIRRKHMRNPNGTNIEEQEAAQEHLNDLNEAWLRRKWFVMLRSQTRTLPILLVDLEDDVVLFDSEDSARKAGDKNPIGETFGFEVFPWSD